MDNKSQQKKGSGKGNSVFYGLAVVIVLGGAAFLYWQSQGGGGGADQMAGAGSLEGEWEAFRVMAGEASADPATGVVHGSESAPILIEEFSDYSCPACARFSGFAGRLLRQNYVDNADPRVRWVTYDYPIGPSFPNSLRAHVAARCAGDQGVYMMMHDMLLARQTTWYLQADPDGTINSIAEEVVPDFGAFRDCSAMRDEATGYHPYLAEIAGSRAYGAQKGVNSTPTIFVDGERVNVTAGDPYAVVEAVIEANTATDADAGASPDEESS